MRQSRRIPDTTPPTNGGHEMARPPSGMVDGQAAPWNAPGTDDGPLIAERLLRPQLSGALARVLDHWSNVPQGLESARLIFGRDLDLDHVAEHACRVYLLQELGVVVKEVSLPPTRAGRVSGFVAVQGWHVLLGVNAAVPSAARCGLYVHLLAHAACRHVDGPELDVGFELWDEAEIAPKERPKEREANAWVTTELRAWRGPALARTPLLKVTPETVRRAAQRGRLAHTDPVLARGFDSMEHWRDALEPIVGPTPRGSL